MNCPGYRCLAANTPDSTSRQADNSISCWKGFLCARSSSGVSWAVRKRRPQPAAASSWAARGYFHIFSFPYIGVFSHGIYHPSFPRGIGFVLPNPTSDTTMPCERLRDVTRGRDRVACAEEDGTKKSLKAAGSDGSQQRGCSSVAAWLNPGPGWLGLCAHERLQKKNQKTLSTNYSSKPQSEIFAGKRPGTEVRM